METLIPRLTIAPDQKHFLCEGKPFFWVGDTVWSAFTNPTEAEWAEYLSYRKAQGFNVLQINTLPQWDRMQPDQAIYPYDRNPDDSLDPSNGPHEDYIARSQRFCQMAVEAGFHLALVVDWANLVPGTWLNKVVPTHVWTLDQIKAHVRKVTELYEKFAPVYIVSGDTDLRDPESIAYYKATIDLLKELAPKSLRTMHLCGYYTDLPQELAADLDFVVYQSGHGIRSTEYLESLPAAMMQKYPGKPVLNAEPCYEAMPRMPEQRTEDMQWEYWDADDVEEACRRSILAGAVAGITYGANGLWNWNRNEHPSSDSFSLAGNMYAMPLFWREALHLPGAGRIAGLKALAYKA